MDLQFVFGNPSKRKKKVSKKRKSKKKGKSMAKKYKRLKKKKNPKVFVARKGRGVKKSKVWLTGDEAAVIQKRIDGASAEGATPKQIYRLKQALEKAAKNADSAKEFKKELESKGWKVKEKQLVPGLMSKGGSVAKRKKKSKKSVKKKHSKKKHVKKHSKKKHSKKKHAAKKHSRKKHSRKKVSRKHKPKYKKSTVVLSHKFGARKDHVSASIPKLKKGKKVTKKYKRKKRRYSFMVKRTNPIFGSPRAALNKVDKQFQTATGHDLMEAGLLFGAGATLPIIEGLVMKIPGMDVVKSKVGSFGNEAAAMSSSLVTILGLSALHYAIEKVPALSKAQKAEPAIRALIAASVVKAGSAMSGVVAKATGMSGVLYTPMSGINYTPMSGINFTPMSGAPQMGVYPQLNGAPQMGYGADFGRGFDVSDYGGGSGYTEDRKLSNADFGGCDDDAADYGDEEPVLDQSGGTL